MNTNNLLATFNLLPAKLCVGGGGRIDCESMKFEGNAMDPKYIAFPWSKPLPLLWGCGDADRFAFGLADGGALCTKCTTFPCTSVKKTCQ